MIQIKTEQLSAWNTLTAFFLNESVRSESSTPEGFEKNPVISTTQLCDRKHHKEKSIQNLGYKRVLWKHFNMCTHCEGSGPRQHTPHQYVYRLRRLGTKAAHTTSLTPTLLPCSVLCTKRASTGLRLRLLSSTTASQQWLQTAFVFTLLHRLSNLWDYPI